MGDMIFNSFSEAASYAKERAKELGTSVKLERQDEKWVVFDPGDSSQSKNKAELKPQKKACKSDQMLINAFWRTRSIEEELIRKIKEHGCYVRVFPIMSRTEENIALLKKFKMLPTDENIELLEKTRASQKRPRGQEQNIVDSWELLKSKKNKCYMCNGSGSGDNRKCITCLGRGWIDE